MKALSIILFATIFASGSTFAEESMSCRDIIVAAQKALGNEIDPQSFSTEVFENLGISIEEFNNMTIAQQKLIYRKIMPIEVMASQTTEEIQKVIDRYSGSFYEVMMADTLEFMRNHKEKLKTCL